jgi:hypothetical protein
MLEVGWPEFALAATRIESTRNCRARSFQASRVVFTAIALAVISIPSSLRRYVG